MPFISDAVDGLPAFTLKVTKANYAVMFFHRGFPYFDMNLNIIFPENIGPLSQELKTIYIPIFKKSYNCTFGF